MFSLTDEQRMLVDAVNDLAEGEFAETAFSWEGNPPYENLEALADRGFLGINIAEEYGGGGMTEFEAMLVTETVGRICPDTAYYLITQQWVAPRAIELFGTDAAKERYLPPVVEAEDMIAIAISEPEAGSDVMSMNTTVRETDDGLVLNGEKTWVSNVQESSAAVVWAMFPEGLGSVIIDFDMDGIEIGNHFTNMFGHNQTQFYMNDVEIPDENVLIRGRDQFKEQLKAINWERLGAATLANSIALCALEKALEYAQDRIQFGQPIANFQGIEWKLADMVKEVELSRTLTNQAALHAREENGSPPRLYSSLANLYSAEMVERVTSESLQIHGANGYQKGHPLEYLYRLARSRRIGAGTDEIQKNTIASALKADGVPSFVN